MNNEDQSDTANVLENVAGMVGTEVPTSIIPLDHPVVFMTRDVWDDGTPREVVDLWVAKPTRECQRNGPGVLYTAPKGGGAGVYCGCYTDAAVMKRFGLVPGPDEVIVIDNPWTS